MSVGRNDPCPCGSGKKYKKCCMKKDNVVEFQEVKEERFYQQKNRLVIQLHEFIERNVPPSHYYRLLSQFKKRTEHKLEDENQSSFFNFWLCFFHRYENGLRGVEWFLEENQHRLSVEDKIMTKRWVSLTPMLLQAVDQTDSAVIFMDYLTKKTYPASNSTENIPAVIPWYSTFGLLEQVQDLYYFNGLRSQVGPRGIENAVHLIEKLKDETQLDYDQILMDYYLEILVANMDDRDTTDFTETEITRYMYTFQLTDKSRAEHFLYNDQDFQIDQWEKTTKKLTWVGNRQVYQDSELDGEIHLGDVHADLEITNKTLRFSSCDLEIVNQFLKKLNFAKHSLRLMNDREERTKVPLQISMEQKAISMDKNVPEYFAYYAQHNLLSELDKPMPKYDHLSLRELVEKGKKEAAERWFQQSEFSLYKLVYEQYGVVEVTADFNTARRTLGLDHSPFVTGGARRKSTLQSATASKLRQTVVHEADIPMYEDLGITPETVDSFYTNDIVAFYQEKAFGKSEATERKYRNSLYYIREILEIHSVKSWPDCDLRFWKNLLAKDLFELNENVSKSMVTDLTTTVSALTKWLADQDKCSHAKEVAAIVKYYRPRMLHAVQLLDHENPYHSRVHFPEMNELGSMLRQIGKNLDRMQTGEFKIISVNKQSVRTVNLDNGETLSLSLDARAVQYAEEGMVLSAGIGKTASAKTWTILHLKRVSIEVSNR